MTTLSYVLPTPGVDPNSIADPELVTALVSVRAWANGQVDDSNLANPNNAVRRLLLQATGFVVDGPFVGDNLLGGNTGIVNSGVSTQVPVPLWIPDAGVSGQPQDFQVAGKSAYCRIRATFVVNSIAPNATLKVGLYQLTSVGGGGRNIIYGFGSALASTATSSLPSGSQAYSVESAQFAMPVASPNSPYALGVNLSANLAVNTYVGITAQLYGYNA